MPFNFIGFLAGRAVAENAGVDRQRATQLAILPGALNLPLPVGLVTARAIAQREAPAVTTPAGSTPPADTGQDNLITVPNLTGQLEADAKKILADMGVTNITTANVSSSPADKGRVVGQSRAPNTIIAKDDQIILSIGQGAPPVKVPPVIGLSFNVASQTLADKGLSYRVTGYVRDGLPKDHVVTQKPLPDQPAPDDMIVELTLSMGPAADGGENQIEVPSVITMRLDVAERVLLKEGLTVEEKPERRHDPELAKDHVIDQNPAPSVPVAQGTPVKLIVSDGPENGEDV